MPGPQPQPASADGERRVPSLPPDVRALIARMPKAELHLHLDGSLRPGTALDLARTRGVDAPRDLDAMTAALRGPEHGADQAALLRAFDLPIALLQDAEALERAAAELVADKAADAVRYVEIRWGPRLHLRGGLGVREGIEAVCRGAMDEATRQGIEVRLICTALRSHDPDDNVALAEVAAGFRDRGLLGWDLAGPEAEWPDPVRHRRAFDTARAGGLRITLHAGEWDGPERVRRALELRPERIAHGATAAGDPTLLDELVRRGICLDLCPTSNVQAGVVPSVAAHPLAMLHRRGVPVTLSTDDLTVSGMTLSQEYERVLAEAGLGLGELWAIDRAGLDFGFADALVLARLREEFDDWARAEPLLARPPRD